MSLEIVNFELAAVYAGPANACSGRRRDADPSGQAVLAARGTLPGPACRPCADQSGNTRNILSIQVARKRPWEPDSFGRTQIELPGPSVHTPRSIVR